MLNIIKITFVIIGTIIGAGFCTGQEILCFFNKYGIYGLFGLFISIGLIGIIIYKLLNISINKNINTYQNLIIEILPNKLKQNKIIIFIINNIINIFLFVSFNIMVAGFSTYLFQEFGILKIIGSIIIACFSFFIFLNGINGIVKISMYLIPIIVMLIFFLGTKEISTLNIINSGKEKLWLISSLLYASYNSICLIPILISLKKYIRNRKEIFFISILTYILLSLIATVIFLILNSHYSNIKNIEIPMVYIANKLGKFVGYGFGLSILSAIFTTAISSGYGFLINIYRNKKTYIKVAFIICMTSIVIGELEFSRLIEIMYPMFGMLGLIQIFFLLLS